MCLRGTWWCVSVRQNAVRCYFDAIFRSGLHEIDGHSTGSQGALAALPAGGRHSTPLQHMPELHNTDGHSSRREIG
ncbi:unnamed protein product [Ectocarpus sp. 12 AP-2014]